MAGERRQRDGNEPQRYPLLVPWCISGLEHAHIPSDRLNHAVALFTVALLLIVISVFGEVDEVIRAHVGDLAPNFIGPCRCSGERGALREEFFDLLTGAVSEMRLRNSRDDLMAFAPPWVSW